MIRTRTLLGEPGEGEAKVQAIQQRIGRRPILAAGNSLGDREMLEYTRSGQNASLCLVVDHDDALREYAYTEPGLRDSLLLDQCIAISMQRDFRRVFAQRLSRRRSRAHPPASPAPRLPSRTENNNDEKLRSTVTHVAGLICYRCPRPSGSG